MTGSASAEEPRRRTVVVGLVADPGLPSQIAEGLTEDLPPLLFRRVSGRVSWELQAETEALAVDEHGRVPLAEEARDRIPRKGWDLMVYLTDLPQRIGTQPVLAEMWRSYHAGLVSIPAVGLVRVRANVRDTVAHVVREIADADLEQDREGVSRGSQLPGHVRLDMPHWTAGAERAAIHLSLSGLRGRARLLAGMVRANRPWHLVPSLSTAIAAAVATAALPIFYSTIWGMADALSPLRLALINFVSVAAMVAWIISHHRLWERPRHRRAREQAVLYNTSTMLTVFVGVGCMYAILLVATLLGALAVIPATYMQDQVGHPVSAVEYLTLAWLASSMGTVAGALGSSLESEEAVCQATYGKREQERRARYREQEHGTDTTPR